MQRNDESIKNEKIQFKEEDGGRQTDRHRETDRHTVRQTDRQTDMQAGR